MSTTSPPPRTAAVVVAAGQGLRAGQPLPKQFALWRGKPVVRHSVEALAAAGISPIVVAIPEGAEDIASAALAASPECASSPAARPGSIRCGAGSRRWRTMRPDHVLIHDAARPDLPAGRDRARLLAALAIQQAAIPVLPVVDSLAQREDGMMGSPADRDALRRVQTPQAFHYRRDPRRAPRLAAATPMPGTMPRWRRRPGLASHWSQETKPCTS